uniref:Uncharacterized protein n=1 Tax=Timspurckia oligopyrenoides TaxID=708627 RepID=A0A7S0ZKX3_9RHOD
MVKDTNELIKSDISNAALDELKSSGIQNVHVFGRRGPAQATWTSKELRELLYKIPNVDVMIDENDMKLSRMDEEELELEEKRVNKKCFQLLYDKYIESKTNAGLNCDKKSIAFHFKVTPIESILNEPQNMLKQVVFARNILKGEMGQQKSEMINPIQELRVNLGLCFSSIGSDVDLDGLLNKTVENFEALEMDFLTRGLKNYKGRLFSYENGTECFFDPSSKWNAVYAAGWLKRGAHGIIGTNKWCAEETIESIKQDVSDGIVQSKNGSGSALIDILKMREVQWIDWNGWKRIDEFEVRQGRRVGRPRQKVLHISEMLTIAGQPSL